MSPHPIVRPAIALLLLILSWGCQRSPSLETASKMESAGQYAEAVQAYQKYLAAHPDSPLAARACLGVARAYDQLGDFERAVEWYNKVSELYAGSPEEIDALLDLGVLYKDKLKDIPQSLVNLEKSLFLLLGRDRVRDAIQTLTDAKILTANAYFSQQEFRKADQAVNSIRSTYPSVFLPTDTRMKVDSLADRVNRAEALARLDATLITVREELDYNKSFDADFSAPVAAARDSLPSPDGQFIAKLTARSGKVPSLFIGKVVAAGKKVRFTLVPRTDGASFPSWSPNSQEMVYRRISGAMRRLEKVDMVTKRSQVLFSTPSRSLGLQAVYHPAGNKIAFVYEGNIWLINANGTNKCMLKTKQPLDYNAQLQWSADGTMIRYRQKLPKKAEVDGVLVLDILNLKS